MEQKAKTKRKKPQGPFLCYALLHTIKNKTYTGITNNFERRLKQHQGKLSGGARYTRTKKGSWKPIFHVLGFETHRSVLQFEWAMKKRKLPAKYSKSKKYTRGLSGRVRQLEFILSLGNITHDSSIKLNVDCFIDKEEYLKHANLSEKEFANLRLVQNVKFEFKK
jgi:predicted GIY-YIG superfamily endonuclease